MTVYGAHPLPGFCTRRSDYVDLMQRCLRVAKPTGLGQRRWQSAAEFCGQGLRPRSALRACDRCHALRSIFQKHPSWNPQQLSHLPRVLRLCPSSEQIWSILAPFCGRSNCRLQRLFPSVLPWRIDRACPLVNRLAMRSW